MKRLKIPKFINPSKHIVSSSSTQKIVKPADMFEPIQRGETKNLKIELKMIDKLLNTPNKEENIDSKTTPDSGFGLMFPISKNFDTIENNETTENVHQEIITSNELANNRISVNGKNYFFFQLFYLINIFLTKYYISSKISKENI